MTPQPRRVLAGLQPRFPNPVAIHPRPRTLAQPKPSHPPTAGTTCSATASARILGAAEATCSGQDGEAEANATGGAAAKADSQAACKTVATARGQDSAAEATCIHDHSSEVSVSANRGGATEGSDFAAPKYFLLIAV